MSVNKKILFGKIGKEPEIRVLKDGKKKMSKQEIKAWDAFKKVMGGYLPTYFCGYESYQGMVDKALEKFRNKVNEKKNIKNEPVN